MDHGGIAGGFKSHFAVAVKLLGEPLPLLPFVGEAEAPDGVIR